MTADRRAESVRQSFDRRAPRYGRNPFTHWVGRSELAALRTLIPPASQPGITPALDFGCGSGRATRLLLECGYRTTGYDLSLAMLGLAQAALGRHSNVTFTANRQELPGDWPLIISLGVLDYYPDTTPLWQEWRNLLAPAGVLVVTAPNAASPLAWLYALVSRFTCPAYPASARQLSRESGQAGLVITDQCAAFPGHPWLGHTLALRLRRPG
jgi:SAM-dependent methyltransferase